jgi:superfamily I DNA/RNA helicase/RecB family exonuclease
VIRLPDGVSASVLGAPGTGKTATLLEVIHDRVANRGWSPDEIIALTQSRASATRLRDAIALRLGVATNGPIARTVNSLAFEIVGSAAARAGAVSPRLVTGGDQDSDLAQLLGGHEIDGHEADGSGPNWPSTLGPDVRRLRGFRTELRELMMRATEFGVSPTRLSELGREFDRPEWVAAGEFISEYLAVISSSRPSQLDATELSQFAVAAIESEDPGERVSNLKLVLVDDLQDATESTFGILRALAARGIAIIAFGDPDVAANAFRGGEPDALGRLATVLTIPHVESFTLATAHRQGPALRGLTAAISQRIGTAAAGTQRAAAAGGVDGQQPIATLTATTPARQWAAVARQLREQHLVNGVPWSDMAVIVRNGAGLGGIRRALALAEVPARTTVGGTALRDDRAARALLTVVDVGTGRTSLTPTIAVELLTGPFGSLDRLALRRLRLALRAEELAGGGSRSSDELLVDGLAAPGRFATIDHRVGRNADRLAVSLAAIGELASSGGSIEELLWLAWDRSGLAPTWFEQALSSGITAAEANHNLDGVVALFTSAKRFVERQPGTAASVYLDAVLDAEVPEDTLAPQPSEEAVLVTTPSGTVGLEFEIVVVAELQDGAWPNPRLRGSLLAAHELVRVVLGIDSSTIDERKLVRDDELRMFALAVSRARSSVLLSSVANDDVASSVFFSLVPTTAAVIETTSLSPLSLRGLTGRLRRELATEARSKAERLAAASGLARLAAERVPGADPADWHGLLDPSTTEPLYLDDETVPVSPSALDKLEKSPLDWFIDTMAGSQPSTAMGVGTILHWAMETATDPSIDALWASIQSRWSELQFESEWMAESQRRAARVLATGLAEYLDDFRRDGKQLVAAEGRFHLDIGRASVNGSIDRVERDADGAVVIVDLKTGAPITAQAEIDAHPQLGAYQLAYAQGVLDEYLDELGEHHSGGAKLLFVKKGKRGKLYQAPGQAALDEEQLEGFRNRIRQAADLMAAAEFEGALELTSRYGGGLSSASIHRVRAVSSD